MCYGATGADFSEHSGQQDALAGTFKKIGFSVFCSDAESFLRASQPLNQRSMLAVVVLAGRGDIKHVRELCSRMHASKILALLPFALDNLTDDLMDMGVDDVIHAPFSAARLALTVRNLLRLHFLERAASEAIREQSVA